MSIQVSQTLFKNQQRQLKIDEQTHSIKISQLADDTTLYFNSKNDISVAMTARVFENL
jgi:hypothetical protein